MRDASCVSLSVDVAILPAEALGMRAECFVVVDLLRATTTIAALFGGGLEDLLVVNELEHARAAAHHEGRLLFGEVGGLPPEGFDHGNSPVEAAATPVRGRRAALFTTNGTAALCALAGRGTVIAGSLANLDAVARAATNFENVAVVCAGNEGGRRFAIEDFAAAGAIARKIADLAPGAALGDAARLAMTAADIEQMVRGAAHARALSGLGLGVDIEFALLKDSSAVAPAVVRSGDGWALLRADAVG